MIIDDILNIQKNSYPYLFIDKILEVTPMAKGLGKKCFTNSEWFFSKHDVFVPDFIVIESLVQIVVITIQSETLYSSSVLNDLRFKDIIFRGVIQAGDVLICECAIIRIVRGIVYAETRGFVNNNLVCSMKVEIAIIDVFNTYLPSQFQI